jgi:DNA-binding CsgD family transcriptional regulator
MPVDKLQSAQLLVVLPGTRTSFRRRVIDALRELVPAAGAFCFFGKEDRRSYGDATRIVDGANRPVHGDGIKLSAAFGFDPKSVVAAPRRAYVGTELWPDAEKARLPYFADGAIPDGFVHALLLFLHEGGVLFGLAGLERRTGEGEFTEDDKRAIEGVAPFIVAGARAQLQYDELSREAAALRSLGRVSGIIYVIDRDKKRVVWAADREHGIDWEVDVEPLQDQLVDAVETSLAARARGDALPTPPRLPTGSVVAVARIDEDPVFGGARCAAVRVEAPQRPAAIEGLSKREREIARLLVAGYSGVNVAAISGLSENTVRTYVRRLYAKLGVNNRADLVRKLVSPEPSASTAPSSQIAPPPDSSLVEGDDTLD